MRLYHAGIAQAALLVTLGAHAAPMVCLQSYRIDHTEIADDRTILFYMNDKSVYRNVMQDRCPGLRFDTRGFTYEPNPGTEEICSNLVTIRMNTTGAVCMLGAFERLPGKPKPSGS
jgi:hypothetical protein